MLNPGSDPGVCKVPGAIARTCLPGPSKRQAPARLLLAGGYLLGLLAFPSVAEPQIRFSDQAEAAGITALNVFGGMEKRYILEAHGSGAGFFDSDNDGDLDLYLVNGSTFETYKERSGPGNSLYRNNGDGTFSDVAAAAGVDDAGWGAGCAVGDIDNDGDRDLYVTNYRANLLYENRGDGTFADVTAAAGVAGDAYSAGAAFFDYDNDGDLDLYVANYLRFDLRDNPRVDCDYVGGIKTYCGPLGMEGAADVLYRNDGGGRFADVTASSGVGASAILFGLGVLPGDFDGDGLVDLYVANDQTPNLLFRNRGDGTFDETGLVSGVAYSGRRRRGSRHGGRQRRLRRRRRSRPLRHQLLPREQHPLPERGSRPLHRLHGAGRSRGGDPYHARLGHPFFPTSTTTATSTCSSPTATSSPRWTTPPPAPATASSTRSSATTGTGGSPTSAAPPDRG